MTQVHEEESEIPIEPFNLIQERKEGRFDHTLAGFIFFYSFFCLCCFDQDMTMLIPDVP